ncbi:MAG: diiron oxygenase [Cupriavidus sp.]|nr:diiron oxygenase [Cupriavidus sp.]
MPVESPAFETKVQRMLKVTERLIDASEQRQMHLLHDHPWDAPVDKPFLMKRERISIYGTPYWDLASEEEIRRLSIEEIVTWWSGFVGLEQLVSEYYMRLVNLRKFRTLPRLETYLKHFVKEEIVHTLVFLKAMDYYGSEMYEVPEFVRSLFDDNASTGEYPLMAVYLTMMVEWLADIQQHLDTDADYVHVLAKSVVHAHWREEMRHIKFGQNVILALADTDQDFIDKARQFTPVFLRQVVDQGVTNIECFDRVGFKHPAFADKEALLEAVIGSPHRQALNRELVRPMMRYFVTSGIYVPQYHALWAEQGFEADIQEALAGDDDASQYA